MNMILDSQDADLFFRLYIPFLGFVKTHLTNIPGLEEAEEMKDVLFCTRQAMCKNPKIIQQYLEENPEKLDTREREIIKSWQRFVHGQFVCINTGKKYATFLHWENENNQIVYRVLGLTDPILAFVTEGMVLQNILLLPFEGRIVWDGLVNLQGVFLGPNMWRDAMNVYGEARKSQQILSTL